MIDTEKFRHLYPFPSSYFKVNGHRLHYIDTGSGEPVVMLHGNPTWSFYFRNVIKALSGGYRCIAPDHIGCGLSDKPDVSGYDYRLKSRVEDLEALLKSLDLTQKITLVVHDWGGMIGVLYALRNPDKIGRIIITNTSGFMPPDGKNLPLRLWILKHIQSFAKPAVLGFNLFAGAALYMAPRKRLPGDVKNGLIAPYNSPANRIATLKFVQDIPIENDHPSRSLVDFADKNLHKLKNIPMMILWGVHDFVFDTDYFNEWKRRFPDAPAYDFPDAGHYLFEDEPEKTTALIRDFLEKNPLENKN